MTLGLRADIEKALSNGRLGAKPRAHRAAAALLGALLATGPQVQAAPRQTPSGLPVPRYVTLKFDKVNARSGPGDDYPARWIYRVRDLPVQVVAETAEWRKVCDPEGQSAWVHKRTTDGHRSVMRLAATPLPLKAKADDSARTVAILPARGLANLDKCKGGWCRVKGRGGAGWLPQNTVWGLNEAQQCR
jgi:SH3-like domain-containing protein